MSNFFLLSTLCLSLSIASRALAQESHPEREPISIRNMRPFNLIFLQFNPESPDILPRSEKRYSLQFDVANNLLIPNGALGARLIEDNETQRLDFRWRQGIGRNLEAELEAPLLWRNGGFLDGILSSYHKLIGFHGNQDDNPAGRDFYNKYHSRLRLEDSFGNTLIDQKAAFGFGDIALTLKRSFNQSSQRGGAGVRIGLKLPTGNSGGLLGSGAVDLGVSVDGRYRLGRDVTLFANLSGVLIGRTNAIPNREPGIWESFVGIAYHPNHRDSYFFQVDAQSPTLRTGNRFVDRANVTATFGYKRKVSDRSVLWVSFSENGDIVNYSAPAISSIGPDITFSMGVSWK